VIARPSFLIGEASPIREARDFGVRQLSYDNVMKRINKSKIPLNAEYKCAAPKNDLVLAQLSIARGN